MLSSTVHATGQALLLAAGMFWQVGWSLVLGFVLSGLVQALVSKQRMREQLGRDGVREIALATAYGAASSSCSYAAAALSKTLFKKGAAFIPSLAFLFASTNLVLELGLILWLLMGWQFAAAEWVGGVVLVVLMSSIVKATYPAALVAYARKHVDEVSGHEHGENIADGSSLWERLQHPSTRLKVAQNVAMDWAMLRTDLVLGFLIAGALGALVPDGVWRALFVSNAPEWTRIVLNALVGPLVAVLSFVCSIGNVPMAAVLWGSGISFGGVLSFLYADLIVLPLLDIYRRCYGLKMAAYIGIVFFSTMVLAGILMQIAFGALHWIPPPVHFATNAHPFAFNYTFWLNCVFGILALYIWWLNRAHPMEHECHAHA